MYQIKRPSEVTESSIIEKKKLRTTFIKEERSITSIENFSNELFYEIFEYLDGCEIYQTFNNLNSRFQDLMTYSSLPLKIKFHSGAKTDLIPCCENILIPNRHRILSLALNTDSFIKDLFTHCILDSSFTRLESVILSGISIARSVVVLFYLKSLPRLFSLTMDIDPNEDNDLSDIYRMIFSLSSLKYNKLSLFSWYGDDYVSVFVPLAMNERFSTIEYLVVYHECTVDVLLSMLHHTPRLRHLFCQNLTESDTNTYTQQPVMLFNLTYVRMIEPLMSFDDFEMFIIKISAKVQILIINDCFDDTYLDANRWERLIIKHMPCLQRFDLNYHSSFSVSTDITFLNELIPQFASLFWIEHQWCFEWLINNTYTLVYCSIHRYRNIWLDIYKHAEIATYFNQSRSYNFAKYAITSNQKDAPNSATRSLPIIQLTIYGNSFDNRNQPFIEKFNSIFVAVQFTRLSINCKDMSTGMVVRIIHLLPHLDSLKISSLPVIQPDWFLDGDGDIRYLTSINNKITKVNLEKVMDIQQIHYILYLCPCIQYFQTDVPKDMDLDMLVPFILIKSTTYSFHLCSLCLSISNTNEEIVHQLQTILESEKLLTNYMMKRIGDNILLKWTCP